MAAALGVHMMIAMALLAVLLPAGAAAAAPPPAAGSPPSYRRHGSSFCAGTHCNGARCVGGLYASATATQAECRAQCDAERCACFQWRDPAGPVRTASWSLVSTRILG